MCEDCVISSANSEAKLIVADIKLYVPVVILSHRDNIKLVRQLESGFKRKVDWNKYQSKVSIKRQNRYLDYLIIQVFRE